MSLIDIDRKTAYEVLEKVELLNAYSNIELNNRIGFNKPNNPSFVREIVYGVIKNKYLLDYYIDQFAKKVDKKDKILLEMGIYQLAFMDSVPNYAAISTTVDLAKKVRYGKDKFINGVLRNFERTRDKIKEPKEEYLKYSIDKDLYSLILDQYGEEDCRKILKVSNITPDLSIRVNTNLISSEDLKKELEDNGYLVNNSSYSNRALIVKGKGLIESLEFKKGYFSIQDQSSILSIDVFLEDYNGANEFIIDTCAAPGGKSLSIREKISKDSHVISCDIYNNKLKLIDSECERLSLNKIETFMHDSRNVVQGWINKADRVLCDVPCSGLGVFRRKPEIKLKNDIDFDELIKTQEEILNTSSKYVKNGGILQYSTCTININENEDQISKFLRNNEDFRLEKEIKLLQSDDTDGFYIARLRKNASRI